MRVAATTLPCQCLAEAVEAVEEKDRLREKEQRLRDLLLKQKEDARPHARVGSMGLRGRA